MEISDFRITRCNINAATLASLTIHQLTGNTVFTSGKNNEVEDFIIIRINPGFTTIPRLSAQETTGKKFLDFFFEGRRCF